jgi:hypothetical protein
METAKALTKGDLAGGGETGCPNNVFLLHLGMNTTWYLHSHLG